jgi:hypothetical protein
LLQHRISSERKAVAQQSIPFASTPLTDMPTRRTAVNEAAAFQCGRGEGVWMLGATQTGCT